MLRTCGFREQIELNSTTGAHGGEAALFSPPHPGLDSTSFEIIDDEIDQPMNRRTKIDWYMAGKLRKY